MFCLCRPRSALIRCHTRCHEYVTSHTFNATISSKALVCLSYTQVQHIIVQMMSRRNSNHSYELLPTTDQSLSSRSRKTKTSTTCCHGTIVQRFWKRNRSAIRYIIYCALRLFLGGSTLFFLYVLWYGGLPPSYTRIRAQERALPQHHWNQKRPGKYVAEGPKFIRFPNHYWGRGLNNVLEEACVVSP